MAAMAYDGEASFFKRTNGPLMRDTGDTTHG